MVAAGTYARTDYIFFTADPFKFGDELLDPSDNIYYEIKGIRPNKIGDSFSHYELDLTVLPAHHLTYTDFTPTVNDARERTKTFWNTYITLANLNNHGFLVCCLATDPYTQQVPCQPGPARSGRGNDTPTHLNSKKNLTGGPGTGTGPQNDHDTAVMIPGAGADPPAARLADGRGPHRAEPTPQTGLCPGTGPDMVIPPGFTAGRFLRLLCARKGDPGKSGAGYCYPTCPIYFFRKAGR